MGNDNLERNPKSEPKKFSRLCTFKQQKLLTDVVNKLENMYLVWKMEVNAAKLLMMAFCFRSSSSYSMPLSLILSHYSRTFTKLSSSTCQAVSKYLLSCHKVLIKLSESTCKTFMKYLQCFYKVLLFDLQYHKVLA